MSITIKNVLILASVLFVLGNVYAASDYIFEISNGDWTNINESITVYGIFGNLGEDAVNASFKGDVYFGAERVGEFQTNSVMVGHGENFTFGHTFIPKNLGTYYVKGFVAYGNELTATQDSSFNTLANDTIIPFATGFAVIALSIVVVGVLAVKIFVNKREYDRAK